MKVELQTKIKIEIYAYFIYSPQPFVSVPSVPILLL